VITTLETQMKSLLTNYCIIVSRGSLCKYTYEYRLWHHSVPVFIHSMWLHEDNLPSMWT